jgi:Fe-S cluster biogenesis protein NfuA
MTIDTRAVTDAVEELARMLRADGGDLVLVVADPKTDRIRVQLVLDDVSCADCILPPDMLFETMQQSLARRVPGEFELLLDDPRRT